MPLLVVFLFEALPHLQNTMADYQKRAHRYILKDQYISRPRPLEQDGNLQG